MKRFSILRALFKKKVVFFNPKLNLTYVSKGDWNNILYDLWMTPYSEDTNESQKIEHENDPEEDKAEIKEFLRKVRSHGSFKIIIGKCGQIKV